LCMHHYDGRIADFSARLTSLTLRASSFNHPLPPPVYGQRSVPLKLPAISDKPSRLWRIAPLPFLE
jgi:hypothetical protein